MRRDAFLAVVPPAEGAAEATRDLEPALHVVRSWDRCRAMGVVHRERSPLSFAELADRREAASQLWRCALPELDSLAEHLHARGFVALLADAQGLVLDSSDGGALCGTDWSEAARGTNAIGTALHELKPLQVVGREHYFPEFLACGAVAAPVPDGRGALVGVLAVSGPSASLDTPALAWVQMAAAQIEHRMLCRGRADALIHFHRRPGLLGTPREGLMLVEDERVAGLNRVAASLLGGTAADWLGHPVADVLGSRWHRLVEQPGLVTAPDGLPWAVSVDSHRTRRARGNGPPSGTKSRRPGHPPPAQSSMPSKVQAAAPAEPPAPAATLTQLRQQAMRLALKQHDGHIAPAARSLGVGRSTLYRWLRSDPQRR